MTHKLEMGPFGYYEVRWTENRRSKRVSTKTADPAEAHRFLSEWLVREEQEKQEREHPTVGRVLHDYLVEHVEEQVIDKRRVLDCMVHLKLVFGDRYPSDLTSDRVSNYKAQRRASGISDSTIRRELVTLNAALNHAVKQRRLSSTEIPRIALPPEAPARDFWLNEGEAKAFLELAEKTSGKRLSRVHRFVAIALNTAARRKSVETLKWEQVDLTSGVIRFDRDGLRQKNKRRVAVPISDRLRPILERAFQERESEYVLDTPYSIQHAFEALKSDAIDQIDARFSLLTIHDLRRTWATLAARAGIDLFRIAGVLGDTIATVEKTYAHHCPDHLRGAVNFQ